MYILSLFSYVFILATCTFIVRRNSHYLTHYVHVLWHIRCGWCSYADDHQATGDVSSTVGDVSISGTDVTPLNNSCSSSDVFNIIATVTTAAANDDSNLRRTAKIAVTHACRCDDSGTCAAAASLCSYASFNDAVRILSIHLPSELACFVIFL